VTPPIARGLPAFGPALGYEITAAGADAITPETLAGMRAVVIASHGRGEEPALVAAARAGVPYIGLVASPRRGAAVLAGVDLDDEQRARVHAPAGLWIGARTPGEIAVSILAEIIQTVGSRSAVAEAEAEAVTTTDPVCGMTVAVADGTPCSDAGGGDRQWFCCTGCRSAYETDPARYAQAGTS